MIEQAERLFTGMNAPLRPAFLELYNLLTSLGCEPWTFPGWPDTRVMRPSWTVTG